MWISNKIERRSTDAPWSCRKLDPPNIPWSHSIQERRLPSDSMVVTFHERISTSRASSDSFHTEKITTIHRLRMKNRKYTYAISRVREHELNVLQMILAVMPTQ